MSGLTGSPLLRPAELLASLTETFTSGLSTVRSPSPLPDITTVATGRFHRRVFHPLDLQLASLHRFRAFAATASWHAAVSDPGEFRHRIVQIHDADMVFAIGAPARHSRYLHNPFHVGVHFGAALVHNC